MKQQNTTLGIWLMVLTSLIFAVQDGLSRHLAGEYNVLMVVMVRFWFFALFVLILASRKAGGLRQATRSQRPWLQVLRGVLLVSEIWIMVVAFVVLGLIQTHAVFAVYPMLVAALSGPLLGEHVGWRRWTAIGIGFVGVLVILQPGVGVLDPAAVIPFVAALMFAVYGLLTRKVGQYDDAAVSLFWTGTVGAALATVAGIWFWEPIAPRDWPWLGLLCASAILSHWMLIRAYEVAEASAVQPFAYLQLVFIGVIGVIVFDEDLRTNVVIGAGIVVAAGLFTLWRTRKVQGGG